MLILVVVSETDAAGQDMLLPSEAVHIALEQNFAVDLAEKEVEIAEVNADALNRGVYPTLNLSSGATYNVDDARAVFSNENVAEVKGAGSYTANASLTASYRVFDGFFRKYNTQQLLQQRGLSEIQLEAAMQDVAYTTLVQYYQAAAIGQILEVLGDAVDISKTRLDRMRVEQDYGQTNQLAVLNAEVDLSNDSLELLRNVTLYRNALRALYNTLNVPLNPMTKLVSEVDLQGDLTLAELRNYMMEHNPQLAQLEQSVAIGDLAIDLAKSRQIPKIDATATYRYNYNNNNAASFVSTSRSNGLALGVRATWDIFDGGFSKTSIEASKLRSQSLRLQREQLVAALESQLDIAWENYQNRKDVYQASGHLVKAAKANFARTQEGFLRGIVNAVEFRQAQQNLVTAETSRNTALFDAKLAELDLLYVAGRIGQ